MHMDASSPRHPPIKRASHASATVTASPGPASRGDTSDGVAAEIARALEEGDDLRAALLQRQDGEEVQQRRSRQSRASTGTVRSHVDDDDWWSDAFSEGREAELTAAAELDDKVCEGCVRVATTMNGVGCVRGVCARCVCEVCVRGVCARCVCASCVRGVCARCVCASCVRAMCARLCLGYIEGVPRILRVRSVAPSRQRPRHLRGRVHASRSKPPPLPAPH